MFRKIVAVGMAAGLAVMMSTPAFAGPKDWKVDGTHSDGEFTMEAKINGSREAVTLGATRVTGTLKYDPQQIENSTFQFDVDSRGNVKEEGSYTVLRFRSQNAKLDGSGKLLVTGALTVTEVQIDAQIEGNEGYSGPQFTGQVVKETTREQSFLVPIPGGDSAGAQEPASADVSTQARISAEDYPELVNAVLRANWLAISEGKNCSSSGDAAEDYSGVTCTGAVLGQRSITRTATSFAEDYPGDGAGAAQAGNAVTLALHLRLTQRGAAPSEAIGQ